MTETPTSVPGNSPAKRSPLALIVLLLGAVIFGVGAALLVLSYTQQDVTVSAVPMGSSSLLREGKPAPEFALKTLDGARTVTLSELRGKKVLINFWASWCPPCVEETPALIEAYKTLNDPNVAFVAIGMQDETANLQKFAIDNGIPYIVVEDPEGKVGDAYGVRGLPTTLFIDSNGIVRGIVNGAVKRDKVIDMITGMQ
jgi:cytochrome c biogenesis protein CcmG, thiol:disulfide interchange protein DsbE